MTNDKEHTFTTGQVSGMTWLTQPTLYKYTQEFPQYFSETATQHKKGRRWTPADLEVIQSIRTLKHSRLGHDKTAGALASGYRDVLGPAADREEFSRLATALFDQADQIKDELGKVKSELLNVRTFSKKLRDLEFELDDLKKYTARISTLNKFARFLGLAYRPLVDGPTKAPVER